MEPLTFSEARDLVLRTVRSARAWPETEEVALECAAARVLAENVAADRDTPALARSVRDGFAVRSEDVPGTLRVIGEVRAGTRFSGGVGKGEAVEIMTGAPMPEGADSVVMVEHTRRENGNVLTERSAEVNQFINPRGCEAVAGEVVLHAGPAPRLHGGGRAGRFREGHGAGVPTAGGCHRRHGRRDRGGEGDSRRIPGAQFERVFAGGTGDARRRGARVLPVARDTLEHTRACVAQGLEADLLLLSGGVSAGKYDVVEPVLSEFGAEFYFDRVLIQPGQPLVFGRAGGKFFFGLPGNPSSTMVTFEIFARAALELLGGFESPQLHLPFARLTRDFKHRAGLTRFLPAQLSTDGGEITPVGWHGSGDIPALTRANAYLVADPDRPQYAAGDWIRVMAK